MNGVVLIDHPDDNEALFRLGRLIQWAGFKLEDFTRSRVPIVAPGKVHVPMGDRVAGAMIGRPERVELTRGYIWPGNNVHIIPTVHPAFIQRGNSRWSAPFIHDIQKAVEVAKNGIPAQFTDYSLDPSPIDALRWAQRYRDRLQDGQGPRLAFDIETPGKGDDEEDADTDSSAPDRTWNIERIGFSYGPLQALSIPWAPEYLPTVRLLMGSPGDKVVWNAGFDVPRLRRVGIGIGGIIHDGMVAWHILHTDLPKRLGFVATFTCPWQPAWKHLSGSRPAYYNAVDADVEWRSMEFIEKELRKTGLWEVYDRDVIQLDPILVHMQDKGMPIDAAVRLDRARKLHEAQVNLKAELEALMPVETRKIAIVYKKTPEDTNGLQKRRGTRKASFCPTCNLERPRKDHFKVYKKKLNPCGGQLPVEREVEVDEYYRLSEFSPSRDQLVRLHNHLKRPLPTKWDSKTRTQKVSFGEEQIKQLILRYKTDRIYPLILEYRAVDKLAGTYVGRPSDA